MTDEKVKEAGEQLQTCLDCGGIRDASEWPWVADRLQTLLDDRDKLAAEVEASHQRFVDANEARLDAEAKLTALVEALNDALSFINEAGGACLGLAMSGSNHPNPDGVQMDISRRAMTLAHTIRQALAHHSAPVGEACATCGGRGEIGGWRGQTAESGGYETEPCPDCSAPPTTPTSAPVEDVGGLEPGDREWAIDFLNTWRKDPAESVTPSAKDYARAFNARLDRVCAALIQPQGEERS